MTEDIRFRVGIDGVQQVQQGAAQVASSMDRIGQSSTAAEQRASGTFSSIAGAAKAVAGLAIAQELAQAATAAVRTADAVTVLNNKLALATGSASAASTAYEALYGIAQRSRTNFTDLGATYASIARATDGLGVSQQRLLKVTEAIGNAMAISGGSAEGMQAALNQLGQGLASGTLRGDELNSVLEQTPRLARAIADGMGVTVGKLRELGKEGQLTAEAILQALESQSAVLAKEVGNSVVTVGQAMTQLSNATTKAIGELDKAAGATSSIASGLQSLSGVIDDVSDRFSRAREAGLGFFSSIAAAQVMGIAEALGQVDTGAANIARRLAEAEKELAVLQQRFSERGGAYLAMEVAKAEELTKRLREAKQAQDDLKAERGTSQSQQFGQASSAIDALAKKGLEEQAAATKLLADIRNKALGIDANYLKQINELNAARQKGHITEKQYVETVQQLTAATFKKTAATKKDAEAMDDAVKAFNDLSKAGREWARSIDLTNAALEKELELRRPLTESERQLLELDEKLAKGLLVMTPAIEAASRASVKRGEALREEVRWQREGADENAQSLARLQDATAALEGRATAAKRDNDQTLLSASALREVERAELQAAAAAKERRAVLFDNIDPQIAAEYRKQAAALRESAAQAGRAAAIEAGKESIQQWERTADTITGLITNAIQMGGEEGWDYVQDYIKSNAIQALVQYGVSGVGQWLGMAQAAGGAGAVAGGGNNWLSMLGTAGQMGGGWGNIANTIGGWVGLGGGAGTVAMGGSAAGAAGMTGPAYYNAVAAQQGIVASEGAAAATAGGGSSISAAIPIIGWIIAAYMASSSAYKAGYNDTLIDDKANHATPGGTISLTHMKAFQALGMSDKWANILSARPLVARLLGHKPSVSGFGIGSVVDGDFVQGTQAPFEFGRNIMGGGADEGLQDLASRLAGSVTLSASLFGGGLTQGLRVGALTDRDRENEVAALLGFFGADNKLIAGTQTGSGAFGAGGPGRAASKIAADELEGWISEQMPVLIIQGLQQSDLDARFEEYFDSVSAAKLDSDAAEAMLQTATAVAQLTDAFEPLGGVFTQFSALSVDTFEKLATAAGGFDALGQSIGTYYQEFYDEAERTEDAWAGITKTLNDVGITAIPKTKGEFRALVDSLDDLGSKADREAFAALMRVAGAFDALIDASDEATQQLEEEAAARAEEAAARANRATQLIDQNIGKFVSPAQLRGYQYGRIAEDLQAAGLSVSAKQLADATKEEVLKFVQSFVNLADGVSELELAVLTAAGALGDLAESSEEAAKAAGNARIPMMGPLTRAGVSAGDAAYRDWLGMSVRSEQFNADFEGGTLPKNLQDYVDNFWGGKGNVPGPTRAGLFNQYAMQMEGPQNSDVVSPDRLRREQAEAAAAGSGSAMDQAAEEARRRQEDMARDELRALEELNATIARLDGSFNSFMDSLLTGALSALSPEDRLAEARSQFEETRDLALGGDLGAMERIDDAAATFLNLQKELTGAATYAPVFDEVLAELKRVQAELSAIKGNTRTAAEVTAASGVALSDALDTGNKMTAQQLAYAAVARSRDVQ